MNEKVKLLDRKIYSTKQVAAMVSLSIIFGFLANNLTNTEVVHSVLSESNIDANEKVFWDKNTWDKNTWDKNTWDKNTWDKNTRDKNTRDKNTREMEKSSSSSFEAGAETFTSGQGSSFIHLEYSSLVEYPLPDWFIKCLIQIESDGDNSVVGDNGSAIGVLQITPIFVEECNRISKIKKYGLKWTLKDRYNVTSAIKMVQIHSKYWGEHFAKKFDIGYAELIQIHRWSANWLPSKMNNKIDNQRDKVFKEYVKGISQ